MKEIRDALLRLVRAGKDAKVMQEAYVQVGLNDNKIFGIYGNVLDAIYYLIGEHTKTIDESVTQLAMETPFLSEDRRVEMLMAEYRKNHPEQPKPNIMSSDGMKELYEQNGGYMTPEGDWS